jgi:Flp pilus assembly pilin Flp
MKIMRPKSRKTEEGQTAIEYLLMVVVAVGLGITLFNRLDEYLIKNPNGMIAKPLNQFKNLLNSDTTGRYRRFPLRLPK